MTTTLLLALLGVAMLGIAAWIAASAATEAREPEAQPFTHDDPRCREVERKLDDARRKMQARGVPLLLDRPDHRRAWKRGNVIEFRR